MMTSTPDHPDAPGDRPDRSALGSILVLPGGGYHLHADHEAEPVADWLIGLGWDSRVFRYPVQTRHPGPLDAIRAEVAAERATGARLVGVLGFSAGGHAAGHSALAPDAGPGERPDFGVLCYPVTAMNTSTHIGSRTNLLGEDPSEEAKESATLQTLVSPQAPPMFIWHTNQDEGVLVDEHAYPLAAALARHGVRHELHTFSDGGHGIGFGEDLPARQWRDLCAQWLADTARLLPVSAETSA